MEKIAITLYDIFGYLIPGLAGLAALTVVFWALFFPEAAIPILAWHLGTAGYTAIAVVAYCLGHVLQAFSALLFPNPADAIVRNSTGEIRNVLKRVTDQIKRDLRIGEQEEVAGRTVVKISDEAAIQFGKQGERDVYVYREGFYRGMSVGFGVLSISMVARLLRPEAAIELGHQTYPLSRAELFVSAILLASFSYLMNDRYKKFAELRVMRPILAYYTLLTGSGLCKRKSPGQEDDRNGAEDKSAEEETPDKL